MSMKSIQAVLLLMLAVMTNSTFASDKKHPIDVEHDLCLAKPEGMTTAGMLDCTTKATEAWDTELNRVYKLLMSKLDASGKESLKGAQIAWLKFRDLEYTNIDSIYKDAQGSMYIPMRALDRLTLTKMRALDLQGYLSVLN